MPSLLRLLLPIVVIFLLQAEAQLTAHQVIDLVEKSCSPKYYACPKLEYGMFEPNGLWFWNYGTILSSPLAQELMVLAEEDTLNERTKMALKEYCCLEGECLSRCRIYQKKEIPLIQNFKNLAPALLQLQDPVLENYRSHIERFLANNGKRPVTAEIEEVYDYIHKNQNDIKEKLENFKKSHPVLNQA